MLKNSLLMVLRGLKRDRGYALINIGGLAIGIGCFVLLGLYLRSELTYDQHFDKHEQIYRVVSEINANGKVDRSASSSWMLGDLLKKEYPEVLDAVRIQDIGNERQLLRNGDTAIYWDNAVLGDQNIFDVFSHEIIYGDPETALIDPLSIAVSETLAKRYFGDRNPIGETLEADTAVYKVTLVFADLPENTHVKYDAIISFNRIAAFIPPNTPVQQLLWNINAYTYLLMPAGYDPSDFREISDSFYAKYMAEMGKRFKSSMRFYLEPLDDIHLNSDAQYDRPRGNKLYIYTFAAIALFVLLVACINYMNLATARSAKRAKEIGMRKVLGATRRQLVGQFIGESLFFSFISLVIAVVGVKLVLSYTSIASLLGKQLTLDLTSDPMLLLMLIALGTIVGVFSGLYPAFYLSFIRPIAALKGSFRPGSLDAVMRQALVFLQFVISVGVIACTILMAIQLNYVNSKPLGFDRDNQVVIRLTGADVIEKASFIKSDLKSDPEILGVTMGFGVPGRQAGLGLFQLENNEGVFESQTINVMNGDHDYLEVLGIRLVAGRGFDPTMKNNVFLVNQAAVKAMGWDDPIGKRSYWENQQTGESGYDTLIGVVEDFHFASLHEKVAPLIIFNFRPDFSEMDALNRRIFNSYLVVKTSGENTPETLSYIEQHWPQYDPKHPFEFEFLDDSLDALYVSEQRQMQLIGIFAGLCILLSCLGLYGLSAFNTQQRTREIGIRKILGATTVGIVFMFFKNILGLILVASIVASSASYYLMSEWLAGFEYRADINPLVFVLAAVLAGLIAFTTIVLQSYKTARASPMEALRYE
jgi:putative ABC transport system permease protein